MPDQQLGLALVVTDKGVAVFDKAGKKLATLATTADNTASKLGRLSTKSNEAGKKMEAASKGGTALAASSTKLGPSVGGAGAAMAVFSSQTGGMVSQLGGAVSGLETLKDVTDQAGKGWKGLAVQGVGAAAVIGFTAMKLFEAGKATAELVTEIKAGREALKNMHEMTERQTEQFDELVERSGLTQAEVDALGGSLAGLSEEMSKGTETGKKLKTAWEEMKGPAKELHAEALKLAEAQKKVTDAMSAVGLESADQLRDKAETLVIAFKGLDAQLGDTDKAAEVMRDQFAALQERATTLGIELPGAFRDTVDQMGGVNTEATELEEHLAELDQRFAKLKETGVESLQETNELIGELQKAGKSTEATAATQIAAVERIEQGYQAVKESVSGAGQAMQQVFATASKAAKKVAEEVQEVVHSFESMALSSTLSSFRVEIDEASKEEFAKMKNKAGDLANAEGAGADLQRQAAQAVQSQDLGALRDILKIAEGRAAAARGAIGGNAAERQGEQQLALAARSIAKLVAELSRITGGRGRAHGGFGGAGLVGEAGPEVFFPGREGEVLSNATAMRLTRAMEGLARGGLGAGSRSSGGGNGSGDVKVFVDGVAQRTFRLQDRNEVRR